MKQTNERTWRSYSPIVSQRSSHGLRTKRRSAKLNRDKIAEISSNIDRYHALLTDAICELATEDNQFSLIIADINALLAYTKQYAPAQRLGSELTTVHPVCDLLAEQIPELLVQDNLTPESELFAPLADLLERLQATQEALKSTLPVLAKKTEGLIEFYKASQQTICAANPEERELLLAPTATLGFKNIATKIARQLLCFDRFGRTFKENESGQHEVKAYKGLYFKRNPRGDTSMDAADTYLDQGMAYLMEALYHVFSDELICAPTELVKIANVPVSPKDPNDIAPYSVKSGYVERAAQVGFGIEGIAFDALLRMIHELQEFSTRFGGDKVCAMLDGWRDQETLMQRFLDKHTGFNRLIDAFALLNKIKKEDSYAEEDSIIEIIKNRNLSNDSDYALLQYELAELQGLTLEKFEDELRQQLVDLSIPVLESIFSRLDNSQLPSKVDPGLVKHWLGKAKGYKFIATLALCEHSPELLSNPKQGLNYFLFLPDCVEHINTLFKDADSKTVLTDAPKLFEKFDDESLCAMMLVHLIARINDAKADNLRVKIIWQDDQLLLRMVDIDSDRALANMLYYAASTRHVKKQDGSGETEKVTIDNHYTGFKSILFLIDAFLDRPINKHIREKLLSAPAVLFVLIWLNKLNAHTLAGEEKMAQNLFSDHDLFENGIPALDLLLKVAPDLVDTTKEAIEKIQEILREDPNITMRTLFSKFDPIISSYYTMLQQQNPVPQDACARLYTFTPSIEDLVTHHDPKHPFTAILNQHKDRRAEFNRELRTSTIPDITKKFVDNFDISNLTESELLEYVDLIGFPYIRELQQLPKDSIDSLLRQAVEQVRLNATQLLIRCYGDVNQLSSEGIPLMHTLMKYHRRFDFKTQILPIFRALQKAPQFKPRQQDQYGNTWIMVFFRHADDNNPYIEELLLEDKGVHINHRNKLGEAALDILIQGNKPKILLQSLVRFDGYKATSVNPDDFLDFYERHKDNPALDRAKFLQYYNYTVEQNTFVGYAEIMRKHTSKTPKEGWLRIEGTECGVVYLSPEAQEDVFDENGRIENSTTYGSRAVNLITIKENFDVTGNRLYIKDDPELPGFEFAVFTFKQMIFNSGATFSELFKFRDKKNKEFPVLFSHNAPGNNIQQRITETKKTTQVLNCTVSLDNYHFSGMVMCALLLNPEDEKPDNFKNSIFLTPTGFDSLLTCFDNDHCFVEGVLNGKLQVKTILYTFKEMFEAFDPDFVEEFLEITKNPEQFAFNWLQICEQQFQKYRQLFGDSRPFPLPITPEIANRILEKIKLARKALQKNQQIIKMDLLKIVEPHVWQHYIAAYSASSDPFERFNKVTKGLYHKHLGSLATKLNSVALLESVAISKAVLLDPVEALKCSPGETIKQLQVVVSDEVTVKNILHDIINHNHLEPLERELQNHVREQAINALDFSTLPEKTQKAVINSLRKKPINFKKLVLRKCTVLSPSDLGGLRSLLRASKEMNSISLIGCSGVSQKTINAIANACPRLIRLNLNNTTIETLDCSKLPYLKTLRIDNCVYLTNVKVVSNDLKYLYAENCRTLVELKHNSRIIRSVNIKGCKALSKDSMANIILSASLDNISMDSDHPDFNPRYLSLQAVNKHQWNEKILALVIRDGLLDLSGFTNLNDDDLMQIARYSQMKMVSGRPMPALLRLDLRGISVPKKGLQYCLLNMPGLQEVLLQNTVAAVADAPMVEIDLDVNTVKSLFCDVEGNITATSSFCKATLEAGSDAFVRKKSKKLLAYYHSLDNGDILQLLATKVQILNAITRAPNQTINQLGVITSALKNIQVHDYKNNSQLLISGSTDEDKFPNFVYADLINADLRYITLETEWCVGFINTCKFGEEFAIVTPQRINFYELPKTEMVLRSYSYDQDIVKAVKIDAATLAVLHQHKLCLIDAYSCQVLDTWYGPNEEETLVEFAGIEKAPAGKLCIWDHHGYLYSFEAGHQYTVEARLKGKTISKLMFDNHGNIIAVLKVGSTYVVTKLKTEAVTINVANLVKTLQQTSIFYLNPALYLTPQKELSNSDAITEHRVMLSEALKAILDAFVIDIIVTENWFYVAAMSYDQLDRIHQFLQRLRGTAVNKLNHNNSCVSLLALHVEPKNLLQFSQQCSNLMELRHLPDTLLTFEIMANLLTNNKFLTTLSVIDSAKFDACVANGEYLDELTAVVKHDTKVFDLSFRFEFSQLSWQATTTNGLCIRYAFADNFEGQAAFEQFVAQFFHQAQCDNNSISFENLDDSDAMAINSIFSVFQQQSSAYGSEREAESTLSRTQLRIKHPIFVENGSRETIGADAEIREQQLLQNN